ncbi:imidazoleglycerol-phosphate dehydratase HisB [Elusimicrobiota bacterium]
MREDRIKEIQRDTTETKIRIKVNLDGKGVYNVTTPNGFFTHMLELLSKHSGIDMEIKVEGDTQVDLHHTVEDTGIVLGEALGEALGDKKGIERYASIMMVMDKVRCDVALDLGGRSNLVFYMPALMFESAFEDFDYQLVEEFMKAFSDGLKATLHISDPYAAGKDPTSGNKHHLAEAVFKGLARVLKQAVKITGEDIPSTKGTI